MHNNITKMFDISYYQYKSLIKLMLLLLSIRQNPIMFNLSYRNE